MDNLLKRAMSLLAQRDYSEWELRRKLSMQSSWRKGGYGRSPAEPDNHIDVDLSFPTGVNRDIDHVIQYCYEHNWLNDHHYTEQFVRSRSGKGYGPRRIAMELQQKGITQQVIQQVLQESDIDWQQLAEAVILKRFGGAQYNDMKNKVKVANFLNYRGFDASFISAIFDNSYI